MMLAEHLQNWALALHGLLAIAECNLHRPNSQCFTISNSAGFRHCSSLDSAHGSLRQDYDEI